VSFIKTGFIILSIAAIILIFSEYSYAGRFGGSFGGRSGFSSFKGGFSSHSSGFSGSRGYSRGYSMPAGFFGFPMFFGFGGSSTYFISFIIVIFIFIFLSRFSKIAQGRSGRQIGPPEEGLANVVIIKTALLAGAKEIQEKLLKLAESGKAGTKEGDAYLFREACLILMRNINSATHAFVSVKENLSLRTGREELEKASSQARTAFDEEGIRADGSGVRLQEKTEAEKGSDQFKVSEYIVVSLIAAFDGFRLQKTNFTNAVELREMIVQASSVPPDMLLGMDVVWDPESPDDILTENDMLASYPELLPL
jgi:uncharacterized membrane protein